jgi:hypothetical protein
VVAPLEMKEGTPLWARPQSAIQRAAMLYKPRLATLNLNLPLLLLNHPKYTPPGHYCSIIESNGGLFSICRTLKFMDEIFCIFTLLITVHVNSLLQTGAVK